MPDSKLKFDDKLRADMGDETKLVFKTIVQEDRSVIELP